MGDVVRTLPAASALRRACPGAHLAWLVEPGGASLLRSQPWLDEVLVFPRPELAGALRKLELGRLRSSATGFLRELRARRFDLVVDFHSILKSGVLSRASGARRRVAYARPYGRELSWLLASETARLDPPRASRFERNAALVRFLGIEPRELPKPLVVDEAVRARLAQRLGPGPAPVVMHPGTSDRTPHKRWAPGAYAAVARVLAEETGAPCLVTSGPARDDRAAAEAIVGVANGAARLAPHTESLVELAALFERCRLYVGGDSGPLHVASLVGTPVVQILGPTDPVENAPWPGTPARTLRVPVACSPCRRGCAAAPCMRVVPPAAVVAAARALLASGGAGC